MAQTDDDSPPSFRFNRLVLDTFDEDFVFTPTGWDFAAAIGIRVDPTVDSEPLDELADAMLVSMDDCPELERLTDVALARLWGDELECLIRERVARLGRQSEWAAGAALALADLDRDARSADVSREVVRHLAMQLADEKTPFFYCLHCLDEQLADASGDDPRAVALQASLATCRNVEVTADELRAAVRDPRAAARLGTAARRRAVRRQLDRIGVLAKGQLPHLAVAVSNLAREPLPAYSEDDDVWLTVARQLLSDAAAPHAN